MRIIILSKAPVPGRVKTRLTTKYSPREAAETHKTMTEKVLEKALSVEHNVWLAADDISHSFFCDLQGKFTFELKQQATGDLGERLVDLMQQSQSLDDKPLLFLGTDSPHVHPSRYLEAKLRLTDNDVVIGPVEDGGYDLIAIKSAQNTLFHGISWGTSSVYDETLNICKNMGLSIHSLSESFDIDRPEDLERSPPSSW
ncbi:MAG: TIGR04282 family arsenosugar biosynthesis glycosyltransferase [Ghiorsea sp.]